MKVVAGVVTGLIAALLGHSLVRTITGGNVEQPALIGALAAFVGALVLAVRAETARYAWGRGFVVCGLLSLVAPVGTLLGTVVISEEIVAKANNQEVAVLGAAVGGAMATMVSAVIGFSLGAVFLIGSYVALRKPGAIAVAATSPEVDAIPSSVSIGPSNAATPSPPPAEADLSNDAYRIYLVRKYKVERNDTLGKVIVGDRLFDDVETALKFADEKEKPRAETGFVWRLGKRVGWVDSIKGIYYPIDQVYYGGESVTLKSDAKGFEISGRDLDAAIYKAETAVALNSLRRRPS